ncbi:hypothetical protein VNO78_32464 [Psophocarpus tetragonolobus]|uniref:Uncharacterized protein n=1 Tax=Psophocarpus tetragonolobus TaxID=3891 RepID=A0AAN9NWW3_PSOTE
MPWIEMEQLPLPQTTTVERQHRNKHVQPQLHRNRNFRCCVLPHINFRKQKEKKTRITEHPGLRKMDLSKQRSEHKNRRGVGNAEEGKLQKEYVRERSNKWKE